MRVCMCACMYGVSMYGNMYGSCLCEYVRGLYVCMCFFGDVCVPVSVCLCMGAIWACICVWAACVCMYGGSMCACIYGGCVFACMYKD